MATRDLTGTVLKLRGDAKAKSLRRRHLASYSPTEGNSLIKDTDVRDWATVKQALPPTWVDAVEDVKRDIIHIEDKMETLTRLHTKRLMVRFDGTETEEEEEIQQEEMKITTTFRHAEKILKTLARSNREGQADFVIRQNVQRGLATKLQNVSLELKRSQKEYMTRVKKQKMGPSEFDFLSDAASKKSSAFMIEDNDQVFSITLVFMKRFFNELFCPLLVRFSDSRNGNR